MAVDIERRCERIQNRINTFADTTTPVALLVVLDVVADRLSVGSLAELCDQEPRLVADLCGEAHADFDRLRRAARLEQGLYELEEQLP